ncbi:hypothetical protein BH09PLA1_BH09PLA1_18210 [soil metagenome]
MDAGNQLNRFTILIVTLTRCRLANTDRCSKKSVGRVRLTDPSARIGYMLAD